MVLFDSISLANSISKYSYERYSSTDRFQLNCRIRFPHCLIVRESAFGACQSDTPSWKWYYRYSKMGSIHTKMLSEALAAGAPPQAPK